MQKKSSHANGLLLDSAALQIPEIALYEEPVYLYSQHDNVNQLVAAAIHDFSPRNTQPILSVDCRTGEISVDGSTSLLSVKRDLTEVLRMVNSGMGEWLKGGSVLLNNFTELPGSSQVGYCTKLKNQLDCQVFINLYKSRSKVSTETDQFGSAEARVIIVPPLRNHSKNIQFFSNYFLAKANMEWSRNITGIDAGTMAKLADYAWPADLIELRDVIFQSALIARDEEELPESTLPAVVREFRNDANSLRKAIITAEHRLIQQALQQARNNKKKAAAILNISRKTLYSKLRIFDEFAA